MGFAKFAHGVCKVCTWGLQSLHMGFAKLAHGMCKSNVWDVYMRNGILSIQNLHTKHSYFV